ncbi:MAG: hypothetical protein IPL79_20355 [Myxococcales bacterium]|nr:hypothetical protein [Myxococcales bacterium]
MADLTSWIGGILGHVTGNFDADATASDYAAKSFADLGNIKSVGAMGVTSSAITVQTLESGFDRYVNGAKSGGEVNISVAFDASDSTYATIRGLSNTNTNVWWEMTDADGKIVYFQGLVANWQETERSTSVEKGATWIIRVNSGFVYV